MRVWRGQVALPSKAKGALHGSKVRLALLSIARLFKNTFNLTDFSEKTFVSVHGQILRS